RYVGRSLAERAAVTIPQHDCDRHHYEAMLAGFGGTDHMDWNDFVAVLHRRGFDGPFEIENEAKNSKDTGNLAATNQGFANCIRFLSPLLWELDLEEGYTFQRRSYLKEPSVKDLPEVFITDLI